jgi:hypothetical protein
LTALSHWNSLARLWGMPYNNCRKRTGYEMRGALTEYLICWLSLPGHQQLDCHLASAKPQVAYGMPHRLPPISQATAGCGSVPGGIQPSADVLGRMTDMPRYDPPTSIVRSKGQSA